MMWHNFDHGWGMMMGGWGWIIGLVVLIVLIWFIVRVSSLDRSGKESESKSALDILKERYVRGEINKEEFEIKKKDISGS